jgi:hypothetical protein
VRYRTVMSRCSWLLIDIDRAQKVTAKKYKYKSTSKKVAGQAAPGIEFYSTPRPRQTVIPEIYLTLRTLPNRNRAWCMPMLNRQRKVQTECGLRFGPRSVWQLGRPDLMEEKGE